MTATEIQKLRFIHLHPLHVPTPSPLGSCSGSLTPSQAIYNRRVAECVEHFNFIMTTKRFELLRSENELESYIHFGHPKLP